MPATGCAVALSAAAAGGVDTRGNASAEGRGEVLVGVGDNELLIYTLLGLGGGYYVSDLDYFLIHNELGVGFGWPIVRTTFGVTYTARVHDGVFSAVGGVATAYFRLTENGTGKSHWALGPRLSATAFEDFGSQWVGLFQLSLVLRFAAYETSSSEFGHF